MQRTPLLQQDGCMRGKAACMALCRGLAKQHLNTSLKPAAVLHAMFTMHTRPGGQPQTPSSYHTPFPCQWYETRHLPLQLQSLTPMCMHNPEQFAHISADRQQVVAIQTAGSADRDAIHHSCVQLLLPIPPRHQEHYAPCGRQIWAPTSFLPLSHLTSITPFHMTAEICCC
jgi:hypothetical protein